ncbi:opsin-5-like [Plakobranchus ocellatus]|uniref:Opsin-5-like n=1 Tax=Plakobranchus ocellatus TaxID=259542 RepID=A0AAV4ARF3_9GAST|nr:opsin-5-like [Plakobranchus ocellatus]
MCISFLLFWTPYAIVAMIKSYASHVQLPVALSVVPALAAKTSHVVDPLIYCALNRNFNQHIPLFFKHKNSKLSEREFTTQSIPLKTIAGVDGNMPISSEA